jgi:hypothetical protein
MLTALRAPYSCVCSVSASVQCVVFSAIVVMVLWSYARTILTSSSVHDNPPPLDYYMRLRQLFPGQPDVSRHK